MTVRPAAEKPDARFAKKLKAPHLVSGDKPEMRIRTGIDLERLEQYAELYASVEDAAALLAVDTGTLQRLLDDPETPPARCWRQGRARARVNVRRAQFAQLEKNATLAIHLGKELLGQDGNGSAQPVTFIVDTGIRHDRSETD